MIDLLGFGRVTDNSPISYIADVELFHVARQRVYSLSLERGSIIGQS